MSLKVITKSAMHDFVASLQRGYRVVGPRPVDGRYIFDDVASPAELHLDYTQTILPPKKYLFPQREELMRYRLDGSQPEPVFDTQPTVVLGVHSCDLHAIELLDQVFSTGQVDRHYLKRRENTVLISVECVRPCSEHSFCKSMGTLTATGVFDLHLTDMGDRYAVDVATERGAVLLDQHAQTREAAPEDFQCLNQILAEKWPRFPYRLEMDVTELPSLMRTTMKSPLWDELGKRCLGCAACTNVCPTCYCFNVEDEVDFAMTAGRRMRMWDSCLLEEFALVAGGHNFRKSQALRQRHRFLRKGQYQTDTYHLLGCVGCGRCAQACLVPITPVDTFNTLYREVTGSAQASKGEQA